MLKYRHRAIAPIWFRLFEEPGRASQLGRPPFENRTTHRYRFLRQWLRSFGGSTRPWSGYNCQRWLLAESVPVRSSNEA